MLKGFKDFLMRGNVIDLAVAVVVGAAFTAIVTAFTSNIIEPLINSLGGTDAADGLGFTIRDGNPETFVNIGGLITAIINFIIIAAIVYFVIVMPYEKLKAFAAKDGDDSVALSESELLTEIRDILQGKDPVEEKAKIALAKAEHTDKDEAFIERATDNPPVGAAAAGAAGAVGASAAGTQKFSAQPDQQPDQQFGPPPGYAQGPPIGYQPPAGPPPQNDPLSGPLPGFQPPTGPPPGYNPNQPQRPGPPQYGPPDYGSQAPGYRPDPLNGPPPGYRPPTERPEDGPGRHSQ